MPAFDIQTQIENLIQNILLDMLSSPIVWAIIMTMIPGITLRRVFFPCITMPGLQDAIDTVEKLLEGHVDSIQTVISSDECGHCMELLPRPAEALRNRWRNAARRQYISPFFALNIRSLIVLPSPNFFRSDTIASSASTSSDTAPFAALPFVSTERLRTALNSTGFSRGISDPTSHPSNSNEAHHAPSDFEANGQVCPEKGNRSSPSDVSPLESRFSSRRCISNLLQKAKARQYISPFLPLKYSPSSVVIPSLYVTPLPAIASSASRSSDAAAFAIPPSPAIKRSRTALNSASPNFIQPSTKPRAPFSLLSIPGSTTDTSPNYA
ncbi:hypothetical protein BDP27DRAFT_1434985 [Rhodocollybia butyracea]|uniref:Uncharacterized protein n=1 Tax=Rhodocollybia butyracea TaxID=206335 RepID=A0A9P5P4Y2_9AGAR|nr:hypothetical protein BDP27DRAFT_1434985 [Rhodocollybia butyracea]